MSRFLVTTEARADLFAFWEHIAEDSLDAADKVIREIEDSFSKLAEMPGIGHSRKDLLDQRYKFWSVYSYVIAYRWEASPIQIIAVVRGARDLDAFFGRRENIQ
jgi:antitoxin ParD1/3/4/toxin ParE1/3/4